ncbi:retrovirus-related pol polyprotein from transposon TNT 1-94 [Tanacetum coccineum]
MNYNGTSVNTKLSKPPTSGTKLYSVTLLPKSKVIPKVVEKNDLSISVTSHLTTNKIIEKCIKFLASGLLKIESEPINTYFKNNKDVHCDYLKVTKEHVATLEELLKEARALKPLDEHIGHVSKFAERYFKEMFVLGHNLFSIGQFYDSDLKVAFRKHTCFVRNFEGVNLLSGSRGSSLYTISMADMMKSSPIYLLSKASKTKSWLWHHRLSHLNFGTINKLAKQGTDKAKITRKS